MKSFSEYIDLVQQELEKLDWKKEPKGLYEPISYVLSFGGKRVRPVFSLIANDVFDGDLKQVVPAALALEIFHNFTLLHDDVMDRADIRRGRPTVHKKWDENTAILSGDAMLIEAYRLLEKIPEKYQSRVLSLFSKMALEICEGQQYDVDFERSNSIQINDYLNMIRLKTAVLLATALQIGALMADADEKQVSLMYDFGICIGIAFQLRDDFLDVYGNEETFGKAIGGDILCCKKTFLSITAFQKAKGELFDELVDWFNSDDKNPQEKIAKITQIYNQLDVPQLCEKMIEQYNQKAMHILDELALTDEKKDFLQTIAQKLMQRKD
ncbi:MAG: polyprenyl synthetase family protein [Paludibacteraceae bacterium]|nr:polyprenyl synthetase family protein [Paludibacteraceae bacterium]